MNLTDKMELDQCRRDMWGEFQKVAHVKDVTEIERFIEAMDRHQAILAKERRSDFDLNKGREC